MKVHPQRKNRFTAGACLTGTATPRGVQLVKHISKHYNPDLMQYFGINYELDSTRALARVEQAIDSRQPGYVCVADGVVQTEAFRNERYRRVVNQSMFSILDSSWVPMFINHLYGLSARQFCGADIFEALVPNPGYKMAFLGSTKTILDSLQQRLHQVNPQAGGMLFMELPYCDIEHFDYPAIARRLNEYGADLIWVSLSAPKQDYFMNRLSPYMKRGVQIGVGAVFKFFSGRDESRCPRWMIRCHMEFIYRLMMDPKKQLPRCFKIVTTLPPMLWHEWRVSRKWRRANRSTPHA